MQSAWAPWSGSVAASLLVGTKRLARWFGLGVVLWGLPLTLVGLLANEPATLVLLTVIGLGNALVDIGLFTLMARLSSDTVMARVFGLLESNGALGFGAGGDRDPGRDRPARAAAAHSSWSAWSARS